MKVISGIYKGRIIRISESTDRKVRPTKTKVREALFSILYSGKNFNQKNDILKDAVVLDLCCGSGSLGIEALSRGAKFCYFIDKDFSVLSVLKNTIADLELENKTELLKSDVQNIPNAQEKCNLIFIDPPYKVFSINMILESLEKQKWIHENAILVVENYFQEDLELNIDSFQVITERVYGKTKICIIQKIC